MTSNSSQDENQREFIHQMHKIFERMDELQGRQPKHKSTPGISLDPFDALEKLIGWLLTQLGQWVKRLFQWLMRKLKKR